MKRYVVEALGTFFIVLAVSLTENPMAIGLVYLAMLYFGARVSGAQYNPAITVALWLRGALSTHFIPKYIGAQLVGACAALLLEFALSGSLFVPDISPEDNVWLICLLETLFTFVLCYLFLLTRTSKSFRDSQHYGMILGFSLIGLTSMGGLFNPAIGATALVLNWLLSGTVAHATNNVLVYVICPLIGATLAGCAFDYLEVPARGEFVGID